ncbi:DUF6456 domain-containing protein [Pseudahrensia aquimaris]|uniref:DUF6456 domain-containing protein n=1 Tax=Pseudahrensia aquimaris TaxID=744461 RepID=A0ABW3FF35_9HYPH
MMSAAEAKLAIRILRFLQSSPKASPKASLVVLDDCGAPRYLLQGTNGAKMLVLRSVLDALHKAELIDMGDIHKDVACSVGISDLGRKKLVRLDAQSGGFAAQHRKLSRQEIKFDGTKQMVDVNLSESPLQRLYTRKTRNGRPWLEAEHVEAGERLRRDFTRGQLMQKTTSNWDFSSGSNNRNGAGGKADLSDTAIDARNRMSRALDTVGPDLATVLTDVCCFLKGLESVEREQKWPPRSAKLMLRTGLDLLARHYGTKSGSNSAKGKTRMWGADNFRPNLNTHM